VFIEASVENRDWRGLAEGLADEPQPAGIVYSSYCLNVQSCMLAIAEPGQDTASVRVDGQLLEYTCNGTGQA